MSTTRSAADTGSRLVSRLGEARTAGSWIGDHGEPVVAVTDEGAAEEVKAAGAHPKMVRHSMDELDSALEELRSAPRVAGTSWSVDRSSNEIVVRADRTVSAKDWKRLTELARRIGGSVRMERTEGRYTTRLNGGQPIFAAGGRCSAGFNVTDGQREFILTAGHCGPRGSVWFSNTAGTRKVGRTVTSNFPDADFSLVQYADRPDDDAANVVDIGDGRGVRITSVADPAVGQKVFRSGSTTGLADGKVTALGTTVNYPEGTVTGLIETTVCAEPGDSGSPMFSEGVGLGVTSGGNGDCESGGTTFFQPITKALRALNVRLAGTEGVAAASGEPTPAASAPEGTVDPEAVQPGVVQPMGRSDRVRALLDQLANPRNTGPGLLVIAGSLAALVASRHIRTEQERNAYRRQYARNWG
jgi:hypothetical protein